MPLPDTALVRADKLVTVVTVPPEPPDVLERKISEKENDDRNSDIYPPFRVAYPTLATSFTPARFSRGEACEKEPVSQVLVELEGNDRSQRTTVA